MPDENMMCPSCGSPMKRKISRRSGQPFLGCTNYPKCKVLIDESDGGVETVRPNALTLDIGIPRDVDERIQGLQATIGQLEFSVNELASAIETLSRLAAVFASEKVREFERKQAEESVDKLAE